MFTGLVEELGVVERVQKGSRSARITVQADIIMPGLAVGDSVAIDGACQTVINLTPGSFTVEAMAETLDKTTLGDLKPQDQVNLERALTANSRLGGHLVSGHVDGRGKITASRQVDIARILTIEAHPAIIRYIAPKGSVAVDGISLTVVAVNGSSFTVSLIPHTAQNTTLGFKDTGGEVNLEVDVLARYVARILEQQGHEGRISEDFLRRHGFA